jgi:hypothetical protein
VHTQKNGLSDGFEDNPEVQTLKSLIREKLLKEHQKPALTDIHRIIDDARRKFYAFQQLLQARSFLDCAELALKTWRITEIPKIEHAEYKCFMHKYLGKKPICSFVDFISQKRQGRKDPTPYKVFDHWMWLKRNDILKFHGYFMIRPGVRVQVKKARKKEFYPAQTLLGINIDCMLLLSNFSIAVRPLRCRVLR